MQTHSADVIVIGGGVAGLAAAGELGRRGACVILLEARGRLGGRIFTERRRGWPAPIELGAQFVHGGNDALWRLLRKHGIGTERVPRRHWLFRDGGLAEFDAEKRIAEVTDAIDPKAMRGWSFARFMRKHGADFDPVDRDLAQGFVEGFEAAAADEMSAAAVAGETLEDSEQYTVSGGYDRVVAALAAELENVRVVTGAVVRRVNWKRGEMAATAGRTVYRGAAAIATLPLGVWQAGAGAKGGIRFAPELGRHAKVAARMGMGKVIRLTLRCEARAWRGVLPDPLRAAAAGGIGFIHSRLQGLPVWWSLDARPVITGWAGGPNALALAGRSERAVVGAALQSLATVLGAPRARLESAVADYATHHWLRDPFSRGAYSFTRAGQDEAPEKLRQPVDGTLYFAGEATADGAEIGTVHGALASGLRAADEVAATLGA